jgi:hypothetical protein
MRIIFRPKTNSLDDILTTKHAQSVWKRKKGTIVEALEQTSELKFKQHTIQAVSGTIDVAHSGWPGLIAMSLPVKYHANETGDLIYRDELEYIALVTHELAHHLLLEHTIIAPEGSHQDIEAHQQIYLFLPDAWRLAYGSEMGAKLVKRELEYPYQHFISRSLSWAEKLPVKKRQEIMAELVATKALPVAVVVHSF